MIILDANMILRIFIVDNPDMADQVEEIIDNNRVLLLPEVAAEVVFVMKKVYQKERADIASALLKFLAIDNVKASCGNVLFTGIQLYRDTSLDFVDCLLCAYHTQEGYEIGMFDKKLQKLMERMDAEQ